MRFTAVLNRDGGSLRTLDLDAFAAQLKQSLQQAGHEIRVTAVAGDEIEAALEQAAARDDFDVLIAGGGDGTVSAAAGALAGRRTALAVLPAGTMNLFARSLGVPLDLGEAIGCFATGEIRPVDIARANGRVFVHQYSVGLHARMIRLREGMNFRSRLGKIRASLLAFYATLASPPAAAIEFEIDGRRMTRRVSAFAVSNNLFRESRIPVADDPAGGRLGIYLTRARSTHDLLRLVFGLLRGRWRGNEQVESFSGGRVRLRIRPLRKRIDVALDGELIPFAPDMEVEIVRGGLNVLVPSAG